MLAQLWEDEPTSEFSSAPWQRHAVLPMHQFAADPGIEIDLIWVYMYAFVKLIFHVPNISATSVEQAKPKMVSWEKELFIIAIVFSRNKTIYESPLLQVYTKSLTPKYQK